MRFSKSAIAFLLCIALVTFFSANIHTALAGGAPPSDSENECIIPPSGPWPPCAIQGDPPLDVANDCVIPPSGPWPPCATGGNTLPSEECVIPPSGPWPPCATGENSPSDEECLIPPVGPWPACAGGPGPVDPDPVTVNEFRIEPPNPTPGQTATIFWNVSDARSVELRVGSGFIADILAEPLTDRSNLDFFQVFYDLPPVGQLQVQMPPRACITQLPISLRANTLESNGIPADEFSVPYQPTEWRFDADALGVSSECQRGALYGRLIEQRFERGWMIQSEPTGVIYYMFEGSGRSWQVLDEFDPSIDPVTDPSIIPPTGLSQPTNAIGKAWRNTDFLRDQLGWAVGDETAYDGFVQIYRFGVRSSFSYGVLLSGADGTVWIVSQVRGDGQTRWQKTAVPNPR